MFGARAQQSGSETHVSRFDDSSERVGDATDGTMVAACSSASCITNLLWVLPAVSKLLENLVLLDAAIGKALLELDSPGGKLLIV